jgi:hypothetical protein
MKRHNIVIAAIVIAGGMSLSVVIEWPVVAERPVAIADINLSALRRQANEALDKLRQADRHKIPARPIAF